MKYRATSLTDTPFALPYGKGETVPFPRRGATAELDLAPRVAKRLEEYGALAFEEIDVAEPAPELAHDLHAESDVPSSPDHDEDPDSLDLTSHQPD